MQRPSHVGEHLSIKMSRLYSRGDISLKIRNQTGSVRVPAVGAVAQALQQLLQQKQITEGSASSLPPGGMWRATPSKATKISRGELSRYRSRSGVSAGGRPLAIAAAMLLACRSIGEDFGWARLITLPPRIAQCYPRSCASLIKICEIHGRLRARELVQNTAALVPAGCEAPSFAGQASDEFFDYTRSVSLNTDPLPVRLPRSRRRPSSVRASGRSQGPAPSRRLQRASSRCASVKACRSTSRPCRS